MVHNDVMRNFIIMFTYGKNGHVLRQKRKNSFDQKRFRKNSVREPIFYYRLKKTNVIIIINQTCKKDT